MTCFSPRPVPDPRRARPTTRPLTYSFATRFARNTYYAALNEGDFKKMGRPCGKCATVKGARGTVKVKIVDICPKKYCKSGHIDLSSPALKKATGYSWDKKPVKFTIGKC